MTGENNINQKNIDTSTTWKKKVTLNLIKGSFDLKKQWRLGNWKNLSDFMKEEKYWSRKIFVEENGCGDTNGGLVIGISMPKQELIKPRDQVYKAVEALLYIPYIWFL